MNLDVYEQLAVAERYNEALFMECEKLQAAAAADRERARWWAWFWFVLGAGGWTIAVLALARWL